MWDTNDRDGFDAHLDEVERLVFNFLNACYSRVEFYRMLVDTGLAKGSLRVDYDIGVRAFSQSPLHRWLFALRRLMQHHALPMSRGAVDFAQGGPPRTTLLIDLEHLRRHHVDGFTGPAYVATHIDDAEAFVAARDAAIRDYRRELLGDP